MLPTSLLDSQIPHLRFFTQASRQPFLLQAFGRTTDSYIALHDPQDCRVDIGQLHGMIALVLTHQQTNSVHASKPLVYSDAVCCVILSLGIAADELMEPSSGR